MIKGKTVFEFRGRHDVLDAQDNPIGLLEKTFGRSLLRSHWRVRDPEGNELLDAQESNLIVALVRRFAGLLPTGSRSCRGSPSTSSFAARGKQVGSYKRILGPLRDRYVLELSEELREVDRRLLVAFTVALDALQDR